MILVTGDTHGNIDFNKIKLLSDKKILTMNDYLIIAGDFGAIWDKNTLDSDLSIYENLNFNILFVDGNHENYDLLYSYPTIEMFGAKMHKISDCIYHVLRGEIMSIDNKTFLCIGGAFSSDRRYRRLGSTYWMEEDITDEDIENAKRNLAKVNYEVDYVLTHCVDTLTTMRYLDFRVSNSTEKLLFIDEKVNYKHWYFGHHHIDKMIDDRKRCFYFDILKIE